MILTSTLLILSTLGWGWIVFLAFWGRRANDWLLLIPTCFAMGGLLSGNLLLLLGFLGLYSAPLGWGLLLPGLVAVVHLFSQFPLRSLRQWFDPWTIAPWLFILCGVFLLLRTTLNPFLEADDIAYHLSVPKAWIVAGHIFSLPLEPHSNFHFLSEMSYLWALQLSPDSVIPAKIMELSRCLMAVLAAGALARCLYSDKRVVVLVMAAVVLLEEFLSYGTLAHVDAGLSLYLLVGITWLFRWLENQDDNKALVISALMLGAMVAVKQTGAALALPILFLVYTKLLSQRFQILRLATHFSLFCLPALPWMIKNLFYTGNPFFPFFSGLFPSPDLVTIGQSFFLGYYPEMGSSPASMFLPDGKKILVMADYATFGNLNSILFLAPMGCLLFLLNRRIQDQLGSRLLLSFFSLVMLYVFVVAPFRRFMIALYPVTMVLLVGELWLIGSARQKIRTVYTVLVLFYVMVLSHLLYYAKEQLFGARKLENPVTLTAAAEREWYVSHATHYEGVMELTASPTQNGVLLVNVLDQSIPLLNVPFIPNIPVVSHSIPFALRQHGYDDSQIQDFYRQHRIDRWATVTSTPDDYLSDPLIRDVTGPKSKYGLVIFELEVGKD